MRTLFWLGSAITLLAAAAVPACGSGDAGGGGGNDCTGVCAAILRPQCGTPNQQECLQDCQDYLANTPATCRAALSAAMSCSSSATYTCSEGVATTSTCNSQQSALTTCLTPPTGSGGKGGTGSAGRTGGTGSAGRTGGTGPAGGSGATATTGGTGATGATCTSVCTRIVAAACANDTLSSCVTGCQGLQSESTTSCNTQFNAFLGCAATATFTCTSSGTADTTSCPTQTTALDTCLGSVPAAWSCSTSWYGTSDGCDCGCSVADPDCAGAGCIAPGCNDTYLYSACLTSN